VVREVVFEIADVVPYWELMLFVIIPIGLLMIVVAKLWVFMRGWLVARRERQIVESEEEASESTEAPEMTRLGKFKRSMHEIGILRMLVALTMIAPLFVFFMYLTEPEGTIDIYTVLLLNWMPLVWAILIIYYIMASLPYIKKGAEEGS